MEHFDLECYVTTEGREMLRLMLQEHFDLGALRERRLEEVRDAADIAYRSVERDHERPLATVVGPISIGRLAYRHRVPREPLSRRRGREPSRRGALPRD